MESDDNVYDYQARIKSLPKVKYSSLTEREKLWMAYNFSYTVCEDFPCGQFAEWMNDQWYGILLRLLKDCGYDTSKVEHVNWKKIKKVVPYFSHVCSDVYDRLYDAESPEGTRSQLYIDQIIMDL